MQSGPAPRLSLYMETSLGVHIVIILFILIFLKETESYSEIIKNQYNLNCMWSFW